MGSRFGAWDYRIQGKENTMRILIKLLSLIWPRRSPIYAFIDERPLEVGCIGETIFIEVVVAKSFDRNFEVWLMPTLVEREPGITSFVEVNLEEVRTIINRMGANSPDEFIRRLPAAIKNIAMFDCTLSLDLLEKAEKLDGLER
jgi:hypothetical protein